MMVMAWNNCGPVYAKIKPPLDVYRRGLCRWNDETQRFEHAVTFPDNPPLHPDERATKRRTADGEFVYFGNPFPLVRVPATPAALADLSQYEGFSCLKPGGRMTNPQVDRDAAGKPVYGWKRDTAATGPKQLAALLEQKLLQSDESLIPLRDRETGRAVLAQSGSVCWNEFRQKWVMIAVQLGGDSSLLGEVWFAEAVTPLGPWVYAVKIATHDRYDFYNPLQHPEFDVDGGRRILFEGTYVNTFSGNPEATPRYNYNQMLYQLDLEDPRTALPVPVRLTNLKAGQQAAAAICDAESLALVSDWSTIAFFACDRPGPGTIPIYLADGRLTPQGTGAPLFHGLPAQMPEPPDATRPLYAYIDPRTGQAMYATQQPAVGLVQQPQPVCRVWVNPFRAQRP